MTRPQRKWYRFGFGGLGTTSDPNTAQVKSKLLGPGITDPWLDTALLPVGISSADAARVPAAVRSIMESTGAHVDQAKWGSASAGTGGRIYVRWKPEREWNAVDYANIAYRIFRAAELQFPVGAHIIMQRLRFNPNLVSDITGIANPLVGIEYAYPVGAPPSDPHVPEAATRTLPEEAIAASVIANLPRPTLTTEQQAAAGPSTLSPQIKTYAIVGGSVAVAAIVGWFVYNRNRGSRRNGK